ncbi:MAG: hypothetical protein ACTHM5_10000 [Ginsengibacter sp.]
MKLTPKEKKEGIFITIGFILFLILLHGNDLGAFRNTDQADAKLDPVLYVICVTPILLFIRKGFNELTLKLKIFIIICSLILAVMPMLLLSGLGKYIDYYTTDKHWTKENVTIINKSSSGGGRGGTTYLYRVKIKDTTIMLDSKLSYPIDKVLHLKMCKTRLGMVIGEEYHDQD